MHHYYKIIQPTFPAFVIICWENCLKLDLGLKICTLCGKFIVVRSQNFFNNVLFALVKPNWYSLFLDRHRQVEVYEYYASVLVFFTTWSASKTRGGDDGDSDDGWTKCWRPTSQCKAEDRPPWQSGERGPAIFSRSRPCLSLRFILYCPYIGTSSTGSQVHRTEARIWFHTAPFALKTVASPKRRQLYHRRALTGGSFLSDPEFPKTDEVVVRWDPR